MNRPDFKSELHRTNPDYVVYVPSEKQEKLDWGNEHFIVFDGKDGQLLALWTQSGHEGQYNQRIVLSRSLNRGLTWSTPVIIAGHNFDEKTGKDMCSWAFPVVSASGRIYVFYSKHIGVNDIFTHTSGLMGCICSDDNAHTWSAETILPLPRTKWDNPDPAIPVNWIVWQRPLRLANGKIVSGVTRWISPTRAKAPEGKNWMYVPSVIDFIRFENIDADPDPAKVEITWLTRDETSVQIPVPGYPGLVVAQEASLVELPDGRIMATMRTMTGNPWYVVSADGGDTWSQPEPLRYKDDGVMLKHSISPCPFYRIADGEFVFFFHNHNGDFGPWTDHCSNTRRPIYMAKGVYQPDAKQPVWFSAPILLMDNDNVTVEGVNGRPDLALYSSFTTLRDEPVLWYPERKFFLLGKIIDRRKLAKAVFP